MNYSMSIEISNDNDWAFWTSASILFFSIFFAVAGSHSGSEKPETIPDGYIAHNVEEQAIIDEYEERQKLPHIQWLIKNVRVTMSVYVISVHVLALTAIPMLLECKWQTMVALLVLYVLSCLGITGGVHRMWAHKSYKASGPYRFLMMIFNSMANQGSIYHWARDHRVHHKYSETKSDPHNALRGFFFSHMGWLFLKKDPRVRMAGDRLSLADIENLPEVVIQRNNDPWWNLFWCFGFPTLLSLVWGENAKIGFFVLGALRYVLGLHATWAVNSFAHMYGETPYDFHANPAENPCVALFTLGEGWHSWHHAFPNDYAASEFGVSAQFNPTKLWIDTGAKLGLVWDRKRAHNQWQKRIERNGYTEVETKGMPMFEVTTVK